MILPPFQHASVTIVGDVMLDHYSHGATNRISPEAPVPIVLVDETQNRAGGAANVAMNVAELGCSTQLLGFIGNDRHGQCLSNLLKRQGVNASLITLPDFPTMTKHRVLSQHQQLLRVDVEEPLPIGAQQQIETTLCDVLHGTDILVISDYGKGAVTDAQALIQQARDRGIDVLVDPKGADFTRYQGATLITPNQKEFEAVVGVCDSREIMIERGHALIEKLALSALLITLGKDGMLLLIQGSKPLHIPTRAKAVFDVTGAGDTVIATIAASLAAKQSLSDAVRLANAAAGWVVGQVGTTAVSVDQLQLALSKIGSASKCVTEEQCLSLVKNQQLAGEKIVMTNGCFDILHPGHVEYLEEAKGLGHRLVIAVNDDASVQRLKGASRPINSLEKRMRVLAALQCVDWVVSFAEDTPARLIEAVAPNILVKGGDYQPEQIAGSQAVWQQGGEVVTIPLVPQCSTTRVIEKIQAEECVS